MRVRPLYCPFDGEVMKGRVSKWACPARRESSCFYLVLVLIFKIQGYADFALCRGATFLMYEEYFGLKSKPFSIVPDPAYFFMSSGHREALAHLMYGIENEGGFVLLTGEVGAGKTTVCRRLLQSMPEDVEVAFILNPKVSVEELLATICDEFRISYPAGTTSIKVFVALINEYLLDIHQRSRRAVVIIEEAQNLTPEVLEQLRLLTNLETNQRKLLQMVMLGQPELREMLQHPQLRQLSQRITARYHLGPLRREEVRQYVDYRLAVSGLVRGQLFSPGALRRLFRLTGGIPRLINVICDRALLGAFVQGKDLVDLSTLRRAAREVFGKEGLGPRRDRVARLAWGAAALLFLCVVAGTAYFALIGGHPLSQEVLRTKAKEPVAEEKVYQVTPDTPDAGKDSGALGSATLEPPPGESAAQLRESAFAALFAQWHAKYSSGSQNVCDQAGEQGLTCFAASGKLDDLRAMNKPAVLKLLDEKKRGYYGTLTSFKGDRASIAVGTETRAVDVKEIGKWWSGEYLLLWREPPSYTGVLRPGGRGPMVAWVEERLANAQGKAVPAVPRETYGPALAEQVKQFQTMSGDVPDGIVGPRTMIGLSAFAKSDDPLLYDGKGRTGDVLHP